MTTKRALLKLLTEFERAYILFNWDKELSMRMALNQKKRYWILSKLRYRWGRKQEQQKTLFRQKENVIQQNNQFIILKSYSLSTNKMLQNQDSYFVKIWKLFELYDFQKERAKDLYEAYLKNFSKEEINVFIDKAKRFIFELYNQNPSILANEKLFQKYYSQFRKKVLYSN